jgi:hypothetical protein
VKAEIWTREQVAQNLRDHDTPEDKISDWYDDNRGDHVLHTAIFVEDYIRFMWVTYGSLDQYMNQTPEESRQLAQQTKERLMTVMNNPPMDGDSLATPVNPRHEDLGVKFSKVLK